MLSTHENTATWSVRQDTTWERREREREMHFLIECANVSVMEELFFLFVFIFQQIFQSY